MSVRIKMSASPPFPFVDPWMLSEGPRAEPPSLASAVLWGLHWGSRWLDGGPLAPVAAAPGTRGTRWWQGHVASTVLP